MHFTEGSYVVLRWLSKVQEKRMKTGMANYKVFRGGQNFDWEIC